MQKWLLIQFTDPAICGNEEQEALDTALWNWLLSRIFRKINKVRKGLWHFDLMCGWGRVMRLGVPGADGQVRGWVPLGGLGLGDGD